MEIASNRSTDHPFSDQKSILCIKQGCRHNTGTQLPDKILWKYNRLVIVWIEYYVQSCRLSQEMDDCEFFPLYIKCKI